MLWKIVRNWSVLTDALECFSQTLKKMHEEDRYMPDQLESQQLLLALSNIIKTEIIDVPGVDEYELALSIDRFTDTLKLSIEDSKSGKYHQLNFKKGK